MSLPGIEVCIFDVNGVLIDSNLANAEAMGRAFSDDPVLRKRVAELYLRLTGIDRGSKIRIIQKRAIGSPFKENEFELRWEAFTKLARQSMFKAPSAEGCREVLGELGRRNIRKAAVSNTPLAELREILAAHDLDSLLDIIKGGGDWPKSESLERFLRDYRVDPRKCLFLGDGKGDLTAARYAGVPFVAIDPGKGEFSDEEGFEGPYKSVADWGEKVLGLEFPRATALYHA